VSGARDLPLGGALKLLLPLVLCCAPTQAQTAAAVLFVEDNPVSEQIGAAAYAPFLRECGAYRKVIVLTGRRRATQRLAAAIRELAATFDLVDVVNSAHTTRRDPSSLRRLIPPRARKLRLVYSSACHSADAERAAWEGLGARTVVTHVGVNNPLVALPYFLSRWVRGDPVREVLAAGFREEAVSSRFALSLPGVGETLSDLYGDGGEPEFLRGSRPVLSGDGRLTIRSGLGRVTLDPPRYLRYARATGGSPGLVLRALAGRWSLIGGDLEQALGVLGLPEVPWLPADALRGLRVDPVERRSLGGRLLPGSVRRVAGEIVVSLSRTQRIPLERGFELVVGRTVRLRVGRVDPEARTLRLTVQGVWVVRGALRFRVTSMTLLPSDRGGYRLRVGGGLWGVVPYWHWISIGGREPQPLPGDLTVQAARERRSHSGVVNAIRRAPTQR